MTNLKIAIQAVVLLLEVTAFIRSIYKAGKESSGGDALISLIVSLIIFPGVVFAMWYAGMFNLILGTP
jgi:hypothetical protein